MSMSSCLSVKAVRQGKSTCLDIWPLPPVEKRLIISMESLFMLFVIWVLRAMSWRICRQTCEIHRFVAVSCLLSMSPCVRCYILPYTLLPAPVRQLYVAQLRYLLRLQIWTQVFFFVKHCIFCFLFTQNMIFNHMVRRFSKSRDFSNVSPVFCCQGCQSRALPWRCLPRGESAVSRHFCFAGGSASLRWWWLNYLAGVWKSRRGFMLKVAVCGPSQWRQVGKEEREKKKSG